MPPDAKTAAYSSPGDRVRAAVKCDGDPVIYLLALVATGTGFPEESTPSGGWADGAIDVDPAPTAFPHAIPREARRMG